MDVLGSTTTYMVWLQHTLLWDAAMDVLGSTTTYMVGLQHTLFVGCCYGCARLNNNLYGRVTAYSICGMLLWMC